MMLTWYYHVHTIDDSIETDIVYYIMYIMYNMFYMIAHEAITIYDSAPYNANHPIT